MNLSIADQANPFDGQLDGCTFQSKGMIAGLYYFFCCLFRIQRRTGAARFMKFKSITIRSEGAVHYQIDGDPGGQLPLTIEVVPERLRVMVPPKWVELQMSKFKVCGDETG